MPKFDKNRHYYNKKGQRIGTGVWVRDDGQLLTPGWADINKEDRTVTQYNTDGTTTTFTWEEYAKKKMTEHEFQVLQNDRNWGIPVIF